MGRVEFERDIALAEALQQPVWTVRPDSGVDYANPFWRAYTGIAEAASLGEGWAAAVHPDDVALIRARWQTAMATREAYEVEYRFRRSDGVYRWHLARVAPLRAAAGPVARWVGIAIDIDDRRRAEEELRASEARYRDVVDNANEIVYTLHLDGRVAAMNAAAERVLGYAPNEMLGRSIETLVVPDQLARTRGELARKISGAERSAYELDVVAKDGRRVTLEINSRMAVMNGRPVAIHGIARDITERRERARQTELAAAVGVALTARRPLGDQLQECVEAMVAHLDAAFARIWTLGADDPNVLVLSASAGMYTRLDGAHARIPLGTWKIGRIAAERRPHLTNSVVGDPEVHDQAWARRERMIGFAGYPLLVGDRLVGVLGMFARHPLGDTTLAVLHSVVDAIAVGIDRARAEAARESLLERERAAREAAEAAAWTVATINRVGRMLAAELDLEKLVQAVTEAATDLTRASVGAFFYTVVDERGVSSTRSALAGAPDEAFPLGPLPHLSAAGGIAHQAMGVVRLADIRTDVCLGQGAPSFARPDGVASYLSVPVISRSGEILGGLYFGHPESDVFDARAEALALGLAAHAAVAIDNARLYRGAQAAETRYRGLFEGVADAILVADAERRYRDANAAASELLGYEREELIRLRVDDVVAVEPGWTEEAYGSFLADGRWQGELELRRRDGTTVPVEARATVVHLPSGSLYLSAVRDVSERRHLERLQRDFLAMVTHDLRSPLTTVKGGVQLLQRRGTLDSRSERTVAGILAQVNQMERLIADLGDVIRLEARQLPLFRERCDLVALARDRVHLVQEQTGRHELHLTAPDTPVLGAWDRHRLGQVLDNLLQNAVKYSPDGGKVTVHVEVADDEARVAVIDRGVGIPAEHLSRLFERFYRADLTGAGGLGLGLYISKMLIEAHGGRIWAKSRVAAGSTFTLALPLTPVGAEIAG